MDEMQVPVRFGTWRERGAFIGEWIVSKRQSRLGGFNEDASSIAFSGLKRAGSKAAGSAGYSPLLKELVGLN